MAQTVGIVGFGLPQERSHVIVDRAFASALEVDKPGFAVLNHYVAALEVAIHESGGTAAKEYVRHLLEIIFQTVFLEIHAGCLEETVFKVVQVPQDAAAVELRLRIAIGEVHAVGSGKLYGGQQADGFTQQLLLLFSEYARLAPFLDGIEQESVSQIFLKVVHVVFGTDKYLGYG